MAKLKSPMENGSVLLSSKWKILGVRLRNKDMERVEKAAAESELTVSKWAHAAVLSALDPALTLHDIPRFHLSDPPDRVTCTKCGHSRQVERKQQFGAPSLPGEDPGCPKCISEIVQDAYEAAGRIENGIIVSRAATIPFIESPVILPPQREVRFSKVQNPDSWDGAKCQKCGAPFREAEDVLSHRCKPVKAAPTPLKWSDEFAKMDAMESGEAMERFRELVAGRKVPKGFTRLSRAEQIRILEREMPL